MTSDKKSNKTESTPTQQVEQDAITESKKIWNEIKDRPIEMFGLPNQTVQQHCMPFDADPNKLFLTIRSSATLPSLEVACGKDFVVELVDKYVIVSRQVVKPVVPPVIPPTNRKF